MDAINGSLRRIVDELKAARVCFRAGALPSIRQLPGYIHYTRAYGSLGSLASVGAARHPERVAIVDDDGAVTFRQLDDRSNVVANEWSARGLRAGHGIGLLARNQAGFFVAFFAAQKLGARVVLLNTDFAGPQLREVVAREAVDVLVYDEEFEVVVREAEPAMGTYQTRSSGTDRPALDALIAEGDPTPPAEPPRHGSLITLTSGTTGAPKGADRGAIPSLTPMGAFLGGVPMRGGQTWIIAPPVFHSFGFGLVMMSLMLGSTVVLRRRFEASQALLDIETRRVDVAFMVPVLLQRLLEQQRTTPRDTSSLKGILVTGSKLGASLAVEAMDEFGSILYNLYGSTEVAFVSIAGPQHLRQAPDTVGPPALGSRVCIYDEARREVALGTSGTIFVGNAIPFGGYTGGGTKEVVNGMMSSGDVGHFDESGLLFVDGRDDAMIVSGGENVFPDEVEGLLLGHPDIADASAVGVADERWGARLRVFVVRQPGTALSADGVRSHVRENLARFKVPRDVVFVAELPRTPTGKVLKRELLKLEVTEPNVDLVLPGTTYSQAATDGG